MPDEEKKVIDRLIARREYFEYNKEGCNYHLSFDEVETEEIIDKILNLIEKQQKEIEKLKEKIKTFKIEDENIYLQFGEITEKKRWKDKIKAKIEELKERPNKMVIDKEIPEEYKNIFLDENAILVLESLLEKE